MRHLTLLALSCASASLASPALADPLDLIDYPATFAAGTPDAENSNDERSVVYVDDIAIIKNTTETVTFFGVDQSGQGAVGCFVSTLATLDAAQTACGITLSDQQIAIQDDYRQRALTFYSENAAAPMDTVTARYADLVVVEQAAVKPFCEAPDEFADFAARLFSEDTMPEIDRMLSVPRLPVSNPCL